MVPVVRSDPECSGSGLSRASLRLAQLARRLEADVIHTNGLKAHLLGGLAGRIARRPVVWHLRDFPPAGAGGRLLRAAARALPALVLANSEAVAATMSGARVSRVYNPVDLERFHPGVSGARRPPRAGRRGRHAPRRHRGAPDARGKGTGTSCASRGTSPSAIPTPASSSPVARSTRRAGTRGTRSRCAIARASWAWPTA